ncbi:uncharacterized protein LOC132551061 isoform X2 [Ylistrum balloti]|uniref:uncharacterized protein LOC132551061 isoform X2 n=1 Tax=Ylistrum balloti TaxID=509963 RepID=UPI002905C375|nr:uncharacterized protein LOC132551061 isoform X2 [Ylistrum balloti]
MSFNNFGQGSGGGRGPVSGNPGGMGGMTGFPGQSQGPDLDQLPPEYAGLANMSEADRNAALEAILGPEGLRQFQQQQQLDRSRGMGGQEGLGNFLGMQGNPGGAGGARTSGNIRPDPYGSGMDFGSRTVEPNSLGGNNDYGRSTGRGVGTGGSMYNSGNSSGGNEQVFNTPQNFFGQNRTGSPYGESQLPPTGNRGGGGGQTDNQDPAQQLIGYVRATAESCTDPIAQGMNTILILDTSKSMLGQGMEQAKAVIEDILTGIEDNVMDNGLEENLALIVFGKETKVAQHLTNDYTKFREALENLHPEGPSSISDSLVMTLGMSERGGHINLGRHIANSRIVILSDAQFTRNESSPMFNDAIDSQHVRELINEVSHLAKQVIDTSGLQLYFIPVGDVNDVIMQSVIGVADGQVCPASDAKWIIAKRYLHHMITEWILAYSQGSVPDRTMIAEAARQKYHAVEDRDIDAVIKLIEEDQNRQTQDQAVGQGVGRGQMTGQTMGQGTMPTQLPKPSGPPGSLPAGIFDRSFSPPKDIVQSSSQNSLPSRTIPSTSSASNTVLYNRSGHTEVSPAQSASTSSAETAGTKVPVYDLSNKLLSNLPSAFKVGEDANRQPEEVTPATIAAKILDTMEVPKELEATRERTRTLTDDIIEEMKRDITAGSEAPKPWDSPCLQEFLLIRKDGTKIEQDSDGNILGDDEEAVLRREEKEKRRLLYNEWKKACDNDPEFAAAMTMDDDIGDLTEEQVNQLLDDFGGGPYNVDNLPNMPVVGLRVKPGPDWMWKCNDVGIWDKGTVVSIDKEDEGWIRVKWDKHNGLEEDYRWGLDYEFDVEPVEGGMAAVSWPKGKERIIKSTQDIADEFGPKQVKEKLRNLARARRQKERAAEAAASISSKSGDKPTFVQQDVNALNHQNTARSHQTRPEEAASSLPPRVPKATSMPPVSTTSTSVATVSTASTSAATVSTASTSAATVSTTSTSAATVSTASTSVATVSTASTSTATVSTAPVSTGTTHTVTTNEKGSKDSGQSLDVRAASKPSESTKSCFVWQYINEQGDWKNYPPDIQKQLEETYLKRKEKGTVIIQMEGQFERVIFQFMEQRNNANKKKIKKVRRIEADAESLRELQESWTK